MLIYTKWMSLISYQRYTSWGYYRNKLFNVILGLYTNLARQICLRNLLRATPFSFKLVVPLIVLPVSLLSCRFSITLAASLAAHHGATFVAAFQVCLQVWLAVSLLADGLAVVGQVRYNSLLSRLLLVC